MRNLIKKGDPIPHFKPNVLEAGQYVIKVGDHERIYNYEPRTNLAATPLLVLAFTNVLWTEANPEDPPEIRGIRMRRHVYPSVEEQITFSAMDYMKGIVKLRKYGNVDDWIPVDDIIEVEYPIVLDTDKVKPGSVWRLTIDGDERFQDTVIMVIGPENSPGWRMRFLYQTEVVYNEDFRRIETAEGVIKWDILRGNDKKIDFNKIHMTPINTNNHISSIDRTDDHDIYYPRTMNGFEEVYPYVPPQERAKNDFGL